MAVRQVVALYSSYRRDQFCVNIVMSVYLCLYVSVRTHISETEGPDFTKLSAHVTYKRS